MEGAAEQEDVHVVLDNIHPEARVVVEREGADPVELEASAFSLRRSSTITVPAGELLTGILMAGDLTESSREEEFQVFMDLLDNSPVPMALTPGNHDVYDPVLPYFNQNFGPGNVAFDVCRTHVAMLDTGSGSIAPSVLGRLPELFSRGDSEFSVAVMHHVPYPETTGQGWSDEDAGFMTLGEFALQGGDLVVAGHAHLARDFGALPLPAGSPRQIVVGTAGAAQGVGRPLYGYARVTFSAELDVCFVEVPAPGQQPRSSEAIEAESGFRACATP
ncbi:MAG: metallophosphoesterase [Myxococcota bacterium]